MSDLYFQTYQPQFADDNSRYAQPSWSPQPAFVGQFTYLIRGSGQGTLPRRLLPRFVLLRLCDFKDDHLEGIKLGPTLALLEMWKGGPEASEMERPTSPLTCIDPRPLKLLVEKWRYVFYWFINRLILPMPVSMIKKHMSVTHLLLHRPNSPCIAICRSFISETFSNCRASLERWFQQT